MSCLLASDKPIQPENNVTLESETDNNSSMNEEEQPNNFKKLSVSGTVIPESKHPPITEPDYSDPSAVRAYWKKLTALHPDYPTLTVRSSVRNRIPLTRLQNRRETYPTAVPVYSKATAGFVANSGEKLPVCASIQRRAGGDSAKMDMSVYRTKEARDSRNSSPVPKSPRKFESEDRFKKDSSGHLQDATSQSEEPSHTLTIKERLRALCDLDENRVHSSVSGAQKATQYTTGDWSPTTLKYNSKEIKIDNLFSAMEEDVILDRPSNTTTFLYENVDWGHNTTCKDDPMRIQGQDAGRQRSPTCKGGPLTFSQPNSGGRNSILCEEGLLTLQDACTETSETLLEELIRLRAGHSKKHCFSSDEANISNFSCPATDIENDGETMNLSRSVILLKAQKEKDRIKKATDWAKAESESFVLRQKQILDAECEALRNSSWNLYLEKKKKRLLKHPDMDISDTDYLQHGESPQTKLPDNNREGKESPNPLQGIEANPLLHTEAEARQDISMSSQVTECNEKMENKSKLSTDIDEQDQQNSFLKRQLLLAMKSEEFILDTNGDAGQDSSMSMQLSPNSQQTGENILSAVDINCEASRSSASVRPTGNMNRMAKKSISFGETRTLNRDGAARQSSSQGLQLAYKRNAVMGQRCSLDTDDCVKQKSSENVQLSEDNFDLGFEAVGLTCQASDNSIAFVKSSITIVQQPTLKRGSRTGLNRESRKKERTVISVNPLDTDGDARSRSIESVEEAKAPAPEDSQTSAEWTQDSSESSPDTSPGSSESDISSRATCRSRGSNKSRRTQTSSAVPTSPTRWDEPHADCSSCTSCNSFSTANCSSSQGSLSPSSEHSSPQKTESQKLVDSGIRPKNKPWKSHQTESKELQKSGSNHSLGLSGQLKTTSPIFNYVKPPLYSISPARSRDRLGLSQRREECKAGDSAQCADEEGTHVFSEWVSSTFRSWLPDFKQNQKRKNSAGFTTKDVANETEFADYDIRNVIGRNRKTAWDTVEEVASEWLGSKACPHSCVASLCNFRRTLESWKKQLLTMHASLDASSTALQHCTLCNDPEPHKQGYHDCHTLHLAQEFWRTVLQFKRSHLENSNCPLIKNRTGMCENVNESEETYMQSCSLGHKHCCSSDFSGCTQHDFDSDLEPEDAAPCVHVLLEDVDILLSKLDQIKEKNQEMREVSFGNGLYESSSRGRRHWLKNDQSSPLNQQPKPKVVQSKHSGSGELEYINMSASRSEQSATSYPPVPKPRKLDKLQMHEIDKLEHSQSKTSTSDYKIQQPSTTEYLEEITAAESNNLSSQETNKLDGETHTMYDISTWENNQDQTITCTEDSSKSEVTISPSISLSRELCQTPIPVKKARTEHSRKTSPVTKETHVTSTAAIIADDSAKSEVSVSTSTSNSREFTTVTPDSNSVSTTRDCSPKPSDSTESGFSKDYSEFLKKAMLQTKERYRSKHESMNQDELHQRSCREATHVHSEDDIFAEVELFRPYRAPGADAGNAAQHKNVTTSPTKGPRNLKEDMSIMIEKVEANASPQQGDCVNSVSRTENLHFLNDSISEGELLNKLKKIAESVHKEKFTSRESSPSDYQRSLSVRDSSVECSPKTKVSTYSISSREDSPKLLNPSPKLLIGSPSPKLLMRSPSIERGQCISALSRDSSVDYNQKQIISPYSVSTENSPKLLIRSPSPRLRNGSPSPKLLSRRPSIERASTPFRDASVESSRRLHLVDPCTDVNQQSFLGVPKAAATDHCHILSDATHSGIKKYSSFTKDSSTEAAKRSIPERVQSGLKIPRRRTFLRSHSATRDISSSGYWNLPPRCQRSQSATRYTSLNPRSVFGYPNVEDIKLKYLRDTITKARQSLQYSTRKRNSQQECGVKKFLQDPFSMELRQEFEYNTQDNEPLLKYSHTVSGAVDVTAEQTPNVGKQFINDPSASKEELLQRIRRIKLMTQELELDKDGNHHDNTPVLMLRTGGMKFDDSFKVEDHSKTSKAEALPSCNVSTKQSEYKRETEAARVQVSPLTKSTEADFRKPRWEAPSAGKSSEERIIKRRQRWEAHNAGNPSEEQVITRTRTLGKYAMRYLEHIEKKLDAQEASVTPEAGGGSSLSSLACGGDSLSHQSLTQLQEKMSVLDRTLQTSAQIADRSRKEPRRVKNDNMDKLDLQRLRKCPHSNGSDHHLMTQSSERKEQVAAKLSDASSTDPLVSKDKPKHSFSRLDRIQLLSAERDPSLVVTFKDIISLLGALKAEGMSTGTKKGAPGEKKGSQLAQFAVGQSARKSQSATCGPSNVRSSHAGNNILKPNASSMSLASSIEDIVDKDLTVTQAFDQLDKVVDDLLSLIQV